ncbi:MAG: leucine-rich repeat protein [Acutalibacteraceae bacterium]
MFFLQCNTNSVTTIDDYAFAGCYLTNVDIPDSVTTIGYRAFKDFYLKAMILNKNVVNWGECALEGVQYVYVPRGINKSFASALSLESLSDIYFEGSKEEWIDIAPENLIENPCVKVHCNYSLEKPVGLSEVVFHSTKLHLTNIKGNIQSGEIVLEKGTYEFSIKKGDVFNALKGKNIMGYNKKIYDNTKGSLTCNARYKTKTKLSATGGIYRFDFNIETNALSVKRIGDIPDVYLSSVGVSRAGGTNLVLRPISGTSLSTGTVYIPKGYNYFNLIIKGTKLYGIDSPRVPLISFEEKLKVSERGPYTPYLFTSTGGMYTIIFDCDKNLLYAREIINNEIAPPNDNIHIVGCYGFNNIELDDNNGESNLATGTITLKKGIYSFKLYNHGVAYGSNSTYYNKGTRTLNSSFILPSVLVADGGKYSFTFDKTTGKLAIMRP